MKSNGFYAIAVIAALAAAVSTSASSDEADGSQYAVKSKAAAPAPKSRPKPARSPQHAARSTQPAGSRVGTPMKSTVDKQALRGQTGEAVRLGRISRGEVVTP